MTHSPATLSLLSEPTPAALWEMPNDQLPKEESVGGAVL